VEDRLDVVRERGLLRAESVEHRGDDELPEGDDDWREKAAGCPGRLGPVGLAVSKFQRPRGSSAALQGRAPLGARRDDGGLPLHGRLDQPPQLDLRRGLARPPGHRLQRPPVGGDGREADQGDLRALPPRAGAPSSYTS